MRKVANLWIDYIPKSYTECHPIFIRDRLFDSINISNSLLDNGEKPDAFTFYRKSGTLEGVIAPSLLRRLKIRLFHFWDDRRFHSFVLNKLDEQKADLAFIHFGTTAAQLMPVLENARIPTVAIFYGSDASSALRSKKWVAAYRKMFPLLSHVIVLCEPVKERLAALGCPREKILVWNLPAGIEKYPYQERPPRETVRFVMCARFIEKKGQFLVLEAYRRLLAAGRKAELTFIGYGSGKLKIEEQARQLGIFDRVRILDTEARGDFNRFYNEQLRSKDIFVLPSLTAANGDDEGGPALTLVCAQAAGLPVICTPFPGSEISVQDGETGLLCKENDVDTLHEKMEFLMDNQQEWNRLGKNASDFVQDRFSEKTQVAIISELFNSLIDSGKRR